MSKRQEQKTADVDGDSSELGIRESDSLADNVSFVRPDHILENLVLIANRVGLGASITLTTSGGVVSGRLVPYAEFWNATADAMQGAGGTNEAAAAAAGALADGYRNLASDFDNDEDEEPWPPRYIHLRNARVHDGEKYVNVDLWRGRLALVVGWSFGETT